MAAKAYRNVVVAAWAAACLMLLLSLTLTPQLAFADDSSQQNPLVDFIRQGEGYSAVLYDNTNGLPTSEANDIVQTNEGFIWIGSYGGLVRYDGNTFERMEAKAGFGSVTCLHVDSQNRLWIGSSDSGVAMIDGGTIQRWREEDGLGADKICDLEEGLDGSIYVGTSEGLTIITPDLALQAAADRRVSSSYIDRTVQGGNGLLYCLTNEDDYFTLRKGKLTSYVDHDKSSFKGITCIFPDPKDPEKLYFGMEGSEVYYGDPLSPSDMELIDISPLYEVKDMSLISDALWICARNGIGFIDDDGFHHLSNIPLNNAVDHVMEDYEGNLWFTSSRQGVMKLVINQFSDVFAQLGLGSTVVNSTCMYDGKLFIGADDGLVVADGEELVPTVPLSSAKSASGVDLGATDLIELLRGCRIRSIIRDSKGRLWISTWRACGLLR